jgi:ribosomal protein S18 acetylase RimI-like enzyme
LALALIFKTCFSSPPYSEKWFLSTARKRISQLFGQPDSYGWVVTVFKQPVGFAFLGMKHGFKGPYGELFELAVHPYFQKQGIGSRLLKAIGVFKKRMKMKNIYCLVHRGTARPFYEKAGFRVSKRTQVLVLR